MFKISLIELFFWAVFAWTERIGTEGLGETMIGDIIKKLTGLDTRPMVTAILLVICFAVRLLFGIKVMLAVLGILLLQLFLAVCILNFFSIELK